MSLVPSELGRGLFRTSADDAQVAKWGSLTNKTKELNTNTNHYSKYTPNILEKIKAGKGIV